MTRPLNIFVPHCSDLLTDYKPHGDGLIAFGFISRLAARGHRLHIAAEDVAIEGRLPDNVHVHLTRQKGETTSGRFAHSVAARRLFNHLKRSVPFDLIHQMNPVFTGVSLAMLGCGLPVVLGSFITRWPDDADCENEAEHSETWLRRRIRHAIAGCQQALADCIILTTPGSADRLQNPRRVSDRTHYLPYGIDADSFSPLNDLTNDRAASGGRRILFLANVVRRKGVLDLLEAFTKVQQQFPTAELVIAGAGSILDEVVLKAAESPATKQIRFTGRRNRTEAIDEFRSADIYCLPSHGEPYGMTAVEAMSCGKPLVVTDAGGLAFLVDEEGGIKVPVRSPDKLAEVLCDLLADPVRMMRMGAYNRRKVVETMAWDRVIDRLEAIYQKTIEQYTQPRNRSLKFKSPVAREDCV